MSEGMNTDIRELANTKALTECRDRLRWAGNLYGAKWTKEEPFLRACETALKEKQMTEPRKPEVILPEKGKLVLGRVEYRDTMTTMVLTYTSEGWKTVPESDIEFKVVYWRELQKWH
ncbi:MAG: hypothetical protein IJ899_14695 [Blautia sp.]|nr:hypothetical protein [Blautia sp.]